MKAQPLIAVRDVERSSRWYQQVLDCQSGHGGPEYEQIVRNGEVHLQLHAWDAHARTYATRMLGLTGSACFSGSK